MAINPTNLPRDTPPGVINPYQNLEVITHKKFISHLGIAFVDLKTVHRQWMRGSKTLLRKVCGQFNYGTLNAILGPWQSGKTTLLKSLAGRNNEEIDHETQFFINGDVPPRAVYLDKDTNTNILLSLTVDECLDFAFRFRNPSWRGGNRAERRATVKELLRNFELKDIQDIELRFCTNEEQIRAQVAMALCTVDKPNMIFIDEPLHDLDAVGIENLVVLLKTLCRVYSIAVIFSVGQVLDSDILAVFDKLYVLSRGGLCVYEGSVDHMSLYLREAEVAISSKIQTPMERLMKVASKPSQVTLRLANQTLTTRTDILHMAQKFGVPAPNGIQTEMASISLRTMLDLFGRSYTHKHRIYWRSIVLYYLIIVLSTVLLTTAFTDGIGLPSACYNRSGNVTLGRFVIIGDREAIDEGVLKHVGEKEIDIIEGQNLIDENVKFIFVITAGLALFQVVTSVKGLNEEVKVAINEHRNDPPPTYEESTSLN
ncbi:PREDICTED: ABC transporter G family member 3-like [Rhagoletis zephyria]|uniref:ABC transporter G family member 3-like n=1 Tax=Rhagoletis zephyria TaxID=28612 RepID=UPI0008117369|nr:PREDICTED: ABC transporter G family member 3-like [Rhagoletis zephyria]